MPIYHTPGPEKEIFTDGVENSLVVYWAPNAAVARENVGNVAFSPVGTLVIGLKPYHETSLAMAKAVALFGWEVTVIIPGTLAESATAKS